MRDSPHGGCRQAGQRWRCPVAALKFGTMDHDSADHRSPPGPTASRRRKARPGSEPARLPSQDPVTQDLSAQERATDDIDPASINAEEDDETRLPEVAEDSGEAVAEGRLAVGHAAIE